MRTPATKAQVVAWMVFALVGAVLNGVLTVALTKIHWAVGAAWVAAVIVGGLLYASKRNKELRK